VRLFRKYGNFSPQTSKHAIRGIAFLVAFSIREFVFVLHSSPINENQRLRGFTTSGRAGILSFPLRSPCFLRFIFEGDSMTQVVIAMPIAEELLNRLQEVSSSLQIEQVALIDGRWPEDMITMAEIFYGYDGFPSEVQSPALRWVQLNSAGVNHVIDTPLWERDLIITSTSGIHAPNIGQYVITQILAWAGHVPEWIRQQARGTWPKNRRQTFELTEIRGQTIGILGYGSLGREIARLAKSFGMRVLVTKRDGRHTEDTGYTLPHIGDVEGNLPDRIYPSEATRSMLTECDYVVVTLPLTEKTHHLLDEEMFRAIKPSAYFINVGRGSLVNEPDLVKALKKGWIAGAGLDVFETEPLPDDSPLWQMNNVILTPHISGFTPEYEKRAMDLFAENLRRYVAGEQLLNVVNRQTGY
jgi:phosphoglycerate dehydrogenase-like enzyme